MGPRWYRVDQFLNRPVASLIAAGCIVLLCGAVVIGGLVFAGSLYTYPKSTPAAVLPTIQPVETPTPQLSIENPTAITSTLTGPGGKIVYVCQIFKVQERDQICIINADGSGQRRPDTRGAHRVSPNE